jgi:hypothetical protein
MTKCNNKACNNTDCSLCALDRSDEQRYNIDAKPTALQKFLNQIILKRVEGSVYLVPAICDFQIEEALKYEAEQLSR